MATAINLALTAKGQALAAKIEAGAGTIPLKITRIVTASGLSDDPLNLNAVVDLEQTFTITDRKTDGARTVISCLLTNNGLDTGYSLTQIGFYAEDPDEGEILYRISQFPSPNYVPATNERGWTYQPTFNIVTGNAENVTVVIDQAGVATNESVWASSQLSEDATPPAGVRTQYYVAKDAPYYTPVTPHEPDLNPELGE